MKLKNASRWLGIILFLGVLPSAGFAGTGSISGTVNGDGIGGGEYWVYLSTSANAKVPAVLSQQVTAGSNYSITGLDTNVYYMRAIHHLAGKSNADPAVDSEGAYGAFGAPWEIYSTGNLVTGVNVDTCPKIKIGTGTITAAITSSCKAADRGNAYYTALRTFEVGYGTGKIPPGSQLEIKEMKLDGSGVTDPYIYVISPSRGVLASDDDSAGNLSSRVMVTVNEEGVYIIEPTSYSSGQTGNVELQVNFLQQQGKVTGMLSYAGGLSGTSNNVYIQLFNQDFSVNSYAWPVKTQNVYMYGSSLNFEISGVDEGTYYLKAYKDLNGDGVQGGDEPSGFYTTGSVPSAFAVSGGIANVNTITLQDPVVGNLACSITYTGSSSANLKLVVKKGSCTECDPINNGTIQAMADIAKGTSVGHVFYGLVPAGNYGLIAFLDENGNNYQDDMEPTASMSGLTVPSGANSSTYELTVNDLGYWNGNTIDTATVSGVVYYNGEHPPGVQALIGFMLAGGNKDDMPYMQMLDESSPGSGQWPYEINNVRGGYTYFIGSVIDLNGNGKIDPEEPSGMYGSGGTELPISVSTGAVIASKDLYLLPVPTGTISGTAYYYGAVSNTHTLYIGASQYNCQNQYCSSREMISYVPGISTYSFVLPALSTGDYHLYAYIDVNNNSVSDYGEPSASDIWWSTYTLTQSVSSFANVNVTVRDANQTSGEIHGWISYSGSQTGDVRVRLYRYNDRYTPIAQTSATYSGSQYYYGFTNLTYDEYFVDAYVDALANQAYDVHEASGVLRQNGMDGIYVSQSMPMRYGVDGVLSDPGTGGETGTSTIAGNIGLKAGTAGVLRLSLYKRDNTGANMSAPFRTSSAAVTSTDLYSRYSFDYLPAGDYLVQAFIDTNYNFFADISEPRGQSRASGTTASNWSVNFDVVAVTTTISGSVVSGSLGSSDTTVPDRTGCYADYYAFDGAVGDIVTITMTGADTRLYLYGPAMSSSTFNLLAEDDGSSNNGNARIYQYQLDSAGGYIIAATSGNSYFAEDYTLSFNKTGEDFGGINGNVQYSGARGGDIIVALYNDASFRNNSAVYPFQYIIKTMPGDFSFDNLPTGNTYYIAAFKDSDWSRTYTQGEDIGMYAEFSNPNTPRPINIRSGQTVNGISFEISGDTSSFAGITGFVDYGGTSTGTLVVEAWPNSQFSGTPTGARIVENPVFPQSYNLPVPGNVPYYVRAYLDWNNDRIPNRTEPYGHFSWYSGSIDSVYVPGYGSMSISTITLLDISTGTGGTASISPSTAAAGASWTTDITFTVGAGGMPVGSRIVMGLPNNFWASLYSGNVAYSVDGVPSSDKLQLVANWTPNLSLNVMQALAANSQVVVTLRDIWVPCVTSSTMTFNIGTANNAYSAPAPLAEEPALTVLPGNAQSFTVRGNETAQGSTGNLTLIRNEISTVVVEGRDMCWNPAPVASPVTVDLFGYGYSTTTYMWEMDPALRFSPNAAQTALANSLTLNFGTGMSSQTIHAVSVESGWKNIGLYSALGWGGTYQMGVQVVSANAITDSNLSTGPYNNSGVKNLTITPDNDGVNDRAYINFALDGGGDYGMAQQNWHVIISSRAFRSGITPTAIWEAWDWGQPSPGRISWDGRDRNWRVVPSGTYFVRIEQGIVRDDSLRIAVTVPELRGYVRDNSSTPPMPLQGVQVNAYGPYGGGETTTSSDGSYSVPGAANGWYSVNFRKDDYTDYSSYTYIGANGGTLDANLSRSASLVIVPSLSGVNTSAWDQWGWVNVHTQDWQTQYNTSFRLTASSNVFTDTGRWDSVSQQMVYSNRIRLNVSTGTFNVEAQLNGFGTIRLENVNVPSSGTVLNLPAFTRKANISGLVSLPAGSVSAIGASGYGTWINVSAIPVSTSTSRDGSAYNYGAWGGVQLEPGRSSGTYSIFGVDPGTYTIRAQAPGFAGVAFGPVVVGAQDLTGMDLPEFSLGGALSGVITIKGSDFSSFDNITEGGNNPFRAYINMWSPFTAGNGWTQVEFQRGAYDSSLGLWVTTAAYQVTGLDRGTTYQMFADLETRGNGPSEFTSPGGFPKNVYIPTVGDAVKSFSFEMASGTIAGSILLPETPAPDFHQVSMTGRILQSNNPYAVGEQFYMQDVMDPERGMPGGLTVNGAAATFTVRGLDTQTMQLTFTYNATGYSKNYQISVINGSTTPAVADLRNQTYSISGQITNQISNPQLNTNAKLVANSTCTLPASYPFRAGTVPIEAVRRDATEFGSAVTYDPNKVRVGYITAAGTYTISGLQEGVYVLQTRPLKLCTTCEIAVASSEKVLTVRQSDYANGLIRLAGVSTATGAVNMTLIDGYNVSGAISLDGNVTDARTLQLTLYNKRQDVVRSTSVALGNAATGSQSNSVDYSFVKLPAGDFYTLVVRDMRDSNGTIKYAAAPIRFPDRASYPSGLQSDLTGQNITLKRGAMLTGKLRDVASGSLITQANVSLLTTGFACKATANPWVEGGYYVAASSVSGRPVEVDGTFRIGPVVGDITYDVRCEQDKWDIGYMRQGAQNYAPAILGGVTPSAGETKDLGVFDLRPGQSLSGTIKKRGTNETLSNIKVTAVPSKVEDPITVETYSNQDGQYVLWVSTYISRYYDITAAPRDQYKNIDVGTVYGEKSIKSLDLMSTATADFLLSPALTVVSGNIVTSDSGTLSYPFGDSKGYPAAAVFMQPAGSLPKENPLGDIEAVTDTDGAFSIVGISTGVYSLKVVSLGYAMSTRTVAVAELGASVGTITLNRGATVSGTIRKAGGTSSPSSADVGSVLAADTNFNEFVFGSVEVDPITQTVDNYTITGFKLGISYSLALMSPDESDIVFPAEGSVRFGQSDSTATTTINLTYNPGILDCAATSKRTSSTKVAVKFTCTKALRNRTTLDNTLELILSTNPANVAGTAYSAPDGTGNLSGRAISSDRKTVSADYDIGSLTEGRFSLRLTAYSASVDPTTGQNYRIDKVYDFHTGLRALVNRRISNMRGGSLEIDAAEDEDERSRVDLQAGSFNNASGTFDLTISTQVGFRKGQLLSDVQNSPQGFAKAVKKVTLQKSALPSELYDAMKAMQELKVGGNRAQSGGSNYYPVSSFYDIFLPAGISHILKERARLTLSYSASADPLLVNVWYYNPTLGSYVAEETDRTVDTLNNTVSVTVDHLSTFVVLTSSPIVTSTTAYTGTELVAFNFPNPFNLNSKSKSINTSPGSGSYTSGQSITTQGTIIRLAVPAGVSGSGNIKIYNMAGELVRNIDISGVSGGTYEYFDWDGKNNSGAKVASGVYIGEVKLGGRKTLFKMAVIKAAKYQ